MGSAHVLLAALSIYLASTVHGAEDRPDLSIVNGDDADEDQYPFMVRLLKHRRHICGASLISSRTVLTAAHCVDVPGNKADRPENFRVVVGDHAWNTTGTHEQELEISQIILQEEYDDEANLNDIALLVLKGEVQLKEGVIETISLARNDSLYAEGRNVTVIGWGRNENGNIAETLQELEYQILDQISCRKPKSQICAKDPALDSFAYYGDSGGPLIVKSAGKFIQVGVVSFVRRFGDGLGLNGFTNVFYFLHWIEETMARAEADVSQWIEITEVIPRIKNVEGSEYVKGKMKCVVEPRKYGKDLNMRKDVRITLVTYRNNVTAAEREVLDKMKYKNRSGVHTYTGTFGLSAGVPGDNCFACTATIQGTELFTSSEHCLEK